MKKKDGGPAFPIIWPGNSNPDFFGNKPGMTLRQWYAGKALVSRQAHPANGSCDLPGPLAQWCFEVADSMIAYEEKEK